MIMTVTMNTGFPSFSQKSFDPSCSHINPPSTIIIPPSQQQQQQAQPTSPKPEIPGRAARTEQLWLEFFSDPSERWDKRSTKKSPKYPDFKHKHTHEGLWIEYWLNPPWVKAKIDSLPSFKSESNRHHKSRMTNSSGNGDVLKKLCQEERLKEAVDVAELTVRQKAQVSVKTFAVLLKECTRKKKLAEGKRVHALMVESRLGSNIFLGNTLLVMYAKCGSLVDASKVFKSISGRNVFSWTAIISAYADNGQCEKAIDLFQQMQKAGITPDKVVFVVVLKCCTRVAALELGKQLHLDIINRGFEFDVIIGNTLVDFYVKCGCIEEARKVFDKTSKRDVISYTAMIGGYAQQGLGKECFFLYEHMKEEKLQPNNVTYVALLNACSRTGDLEQGKHIHAQIIKSGFESDLFVASALVDMYVKCACLECARQVFDDMNERNVVSWTSMIAGYTQQGLGKEALQLYERMSKESVQPDDVTYVILLNACASIAALKQGKQLHSDIIKKGCGSNVIIGNALVDMYAKCGSIEQACQVFNNMNNRNVITWNALIAGYAQQGLGKDALLLLEGMQREGIQPNEVTYASLLSACSRCGLIDEGHQLFNSLLQDYSVTPTSDHYASMVDLLSRAGSLADAEDFINKMPIMPGASVWMSLLGAAKNHGNAEIGKRAFDHLVKLVPDNASAYVLFSNI